MWPHRVTEAEGRGLDELKKSDAEFLVKLWQTIQERAKSATVPAVIHTELSLPLPHSARPRSSPM